MSLAQKAAEEVAVAKSRSLRQLSQSARPVRPIIAGSSVAPALPTDLEPLLMEGRRAAPGTQPLINAVVRRAQQTYGNRAVQRFLETAASAPAIEPNPTVRRERLAIQRTAETQHAGLISPQLLSLGSSGPAVARLQEMLNTSGLILEPLDLEGNFGPLTQGAVVAFQKAQNLKPDGIVGPRTNEALLGKAVGPFVVFESLPF